MKFKCRAEQKAREGGEKQGRRMGVKSREIKEVGVKKSPEYMKNL